MEGRYTGVHGPRWQTRRDWVEWVSRTLAPSMMASLEGNSGGFSKILILCGPVCLIRGFYFPNSSCLKVGKGATPSWIWTSLLEGRKLLQEGLKWSVGKGGSILFWEDNWVPNLPSDRKLSSPPAGCQWKWVSNFLLQHNGAWDIHKLQSCVNEDDLQAIIRTPTSINKGHDSLV